MLTATMINQQNNYDMGNQKSEAALECLVESIGHEDACDLLRSTQHIMVERSIMFSK